MATVIPVSIIPIAPIPMLTTLPNPVFGVMSPYPMDSPVMNVK